MRTNNRKGFTLAELLIVVAILGVLVAVAIPVFTSSLEKARLAVDDANERSAQAMAALYELTGRIGEIAEPTEDNELYYFTTDGTLVRRTLSSNLTPQPPENAYRAQADKAGSHEKGYYLYIQLLRSTHADTKWSANVIWANY